MEVLSSDDLFDPPSSLARIARGISVGIRKEQVSAPHAIPPGRARDALLKVGEREGRQLGLERGRCSLVGHEIAHRFVAPPGRPGRQPAVSASVRRWARKAGGASSVSPVLAGTPESTKISRETAVLTGDRRQQQPPPLCRRGRSGLTACSLRPGRHRCDTATVVAAPWRRREATDKHLSSTPLELAGDRPRRAGAPWRAVNEDEDRRSVASDHSESMTGRARLPSHGGSFGVGDSRQPSRRGGETLRGCQRAPLVIGGENVMQRTPAVI